MVRTVAAELMPMVVDQAVPSEVQSTVGSDMKASPVTSGSRVWPQEVPPLEEKNIAWRPLESRAGLHVVLRELRLHGRPFQPAAGRHRLRRRQEGGESQTHHEDTEPPALLQSIHLLFLPFLGKSVWTTFRQTAAQPPQEA